MGAWGDNWKIENISLLLPAGAAGVRNGDRHRSRRFLPRRLI